MNLTMLWRLVPCLCLNSACKRHIMAPFHCWGHRGPERWGDHSERTEPSPGPELCAAKVALLLPTGLHGHSHLSGSNGKNRWSQISNLREIGKSVPGSQNNWPHQIGPVAPLISSLSAFGRLSLPHVSFLIFPGEVIKVQALFHYRSLFQWTQMDWCSWNVVEFSGQQ